MLIMPEENKCGKTSASRPRAEGTLSAHQPETIAEEVLYVLKKIKEVI